MKKTRFVLFVILSLCVLCLFGCSAQTYTGTVYVGDIFDATATAFQEMDSITLSGEEYQDPDAVMHRQLTWGDYVWELEYDCSCDMTVLDFEIDVYTVVGAPDYCNVTFKKDTDEVIRIFRIPTDIKIQGMDKEEYDTIVTSVIDSFSDISLDSLTRKDHTTHTISSENGVSGGNVKDGFYLPAENEEVSFYTTYYEERLSENYRSVKHAVVELDSQGGLFVEIYDIDTTDVSDFLREQTVSLEENFSVFAKKQIESSGYEFDAVHCGTVEIFSKNGKIYVDIIATIHYLEASKEHFTVGNFIVEYS